MSRKIGWAISGVTLVAVALAFAVSWSWLAKDDSAPTNDAPVRVTPAQALRNVRSVPAGERIELRGPRAEAFASSRLPSNSDLPPLGTNWQTEFAQLNARAQRGDAVAARRLAHDTVYCRQWPQLHKFVKSVGLMLANEELDKVARARLEASVVGLRARAEAQPSTCTGLPDSAVESALFPVLRQAAALGDTDSAVCYVHYAARTILLGTKTDPNLIETRNRQAFAFIENGLMRGDWRVVRIMAQAHDCCGPINDAYSPLVESEPAKGYAWLTLVTLGAPVEESDRAQNQADELDRQFNLSSKAKRAATDWAVAMYEAHFAGKPWPEPMRVCRAE